MLSVLKNIPVSYRGELHQVKLVNFSVAMDEVLPLVPAGIKVRDFNGRALISIVNVQLKKTRPTFIPGFLHFNYQHIGFRLLVEDAGLNNGQNKGVYFIRSFTNKSWIVLGGRYFTNYKLETAHLTTTENSFLLRKADYYLEYKTTGIQPKVNPELKEIVGTLDRAYSGSKTNLRMVKIQREKWPLAEIAVTDFKTNFFKTAQLEGAFRVPETIFYQWLPSQKIKLCAL